MSDVEPDELEFVPRRDIVPQRSRHTDRCLEEAALPPYIPCTGEDGKIVVHPGRKDLKELKKLHRPASQIPGTRQGNTAIGRRDDQEKVDYGTSSSSSSSSSDDDSTLQNISYTYKPTERDDQRASALAISGRKDEHVRDLRRRKAIGQTFFDRNGACKWPYNSPTVEEMVDAHLELKGNEKMNITPSQVSQRYIYIQK